MDQVDQLFNNFRGAPFRAMGVDDPNATIYDGQGLDSINTAALVTPGLVNNDGNTVVIDESGITIIDGALTVKNSSGNTIVDGATAGGTIQNSTGEVVIDSSGITVTGGAITVTNGSSTVIIDGTSDMFKIASTGTLSDSTATHVSGDTVQSTLTSLGTWASMPAHLSLLGSVASGSQSNAGARITGDGQYFAASSSGGSPTSRVVAGASVGQYVFMELDGSSQLLITMITTNATASTYDSIWRYYVLLEAGI